MDRSRRLVRIAGITVRIIVIAGNLNSSSPGQRHGPPKDIARLPLEIVVADPNQSLTRSLRTDGRNLNGFPQQIHLREDRDRFSVVAERVGSLDPERWVTRRDFEFGIKDGGAAEFLIHAALRKVESNTGQVLRLTSGLPIVNLENQSGSARQEMGNT